MKTKVLSLMLIGIWCSGYGMENNNNSNTALALKKNQIKETSADIDLRNLVHFSDMQSDQMTEQKWLQYNKDVQHKKNNFTSTSIKSEKLKQAGSSWNWEAFRNLAKNQQRFLASNYDQDEYIIYLRKKIVRQETENDMTTKERSIALTSLKEVQDDNSIEKCRMEDNRNYSIGYAVPFIGLGLSWPLWGGRQMLKNFKSKFISFDNMILLGGLTFFGCAAFYNLGWAKQYHELVKYHREIEKKLNDLQDLAQPSKAEENESNNNNNNDTH